MSGTVLSTLCSICHTETPKYRCPRCGVRTCSVACIQKHKARADCDGVRNPRAFMPLKQLKTEAGIDHDYNFIHSIERAVQRAEKDVVEARQLLSAKDLRPKNDDKVFQKVWRGDELHHVPVQPSSHPFKKHGRAHDGPSPTFIDGFDKQVRRRLRHLGIEVITMPKGMVRQRENKTAFNRRTGTINWQVEWLVYSAGQLGVPAQPEQQPLRILHKTLEGTPLDTALATTLDWHLKQLERRSEDQQDLNPTDDSLASPKKKRKTHHQPTKPTTIPSSNLPTQDPTTTTWPAAPSTSRSPTTSAWSDTPSPFPSTNPTSTSTTTTISPRITILQSHLSTFSFYLVRATKPSSTSSSTTRKAVQPNKTLIPLSASDTLATALAGRAVVEFPTVVAVPAGSELLEGEGWFVGEGETGEEKAGRLGRAGHAGSRGGDGEVGVGESRERERGGRGGRDGGRGGADRGGRGGGSGHRGGLLLGRKRGHENGDVGGVEGWNGRGGGRQGKRVRFDPAGRLARNGGGKEAEEVEEGEVEEGEVGESGEEGEVEEGEVTRSVGTAGGGQMDVDEGGESAEEGEVESVSDLSSNTVGRVGEEDDEEGEVQETGPTASRGGLVDYGSSDESD